MSTASRLLLFISIILFSFSSVFASDIALLTVSNESDAIIGTSIFGSAYGRANGKFIVETDDLMLLQAEQAGLTIDLIYPGASAADVKYVMKPESGTRLSKFDTDLLGRSVELPDGTFLAQFGGAVSFALREQAGAMVIPLIDNQIDIFYDEPRIILPLPELFTYPTDTLVELVSQDSVYYFDTHLENYYTRYIYTDSIDRARDWMVGQFTDWGYTDVTTPQFWYGSSYHYNVQTIKEGTIEPEVVIVVGAHYDAVTYNQPLPADVYAPGADDNASGTSIVLELARILKDIPLRKTVIFIPFSAEEVGLRGSRFAANEFKEAGTNIEVMYNFDMVGYTNGQPWYIDVETGDYNLYGNITVAAGQRVTSLMPGITPQSGSSDHAPFRDLGYPIAYINENNFNTLGWHTNLDLSSRLDFPYLTEAVKMILASLLVVAESPSPTRIDNIIDVGDGQSLEVFWSGCKSIDQAILYHGTSEGSYPDSVLVPQGDCSYIWDGLTEGEQNYFVVANVGPNGYRSLSAVGSSEVALNVPRPPDSPTAISDSALIEISWLENKEADFSHYNLYRTIMLIGQQVLLHENITQTSIVDYDVLSGVEYSYSVSAVDFDGNESVLSAEVSAFAPFFDNGIGVIDAFTTENQYTPTQEAQEAWIDSLFGSYKYRISRIDRSFDTLTASGIGPFKSIFWLDDDLNTNVIAASNDILEWYAGYEVNMLISGYSSILGWSNSPIPTNHLLYTNFMISGYNYWGSPDFVGAFGQNGWPSVEIDPSRGLNEFPNIPALEVRPGGEVIYTYDSYIDWPDFEGKPVGVAYDSPKGKRVVLSFPLYNMTPASAKALIDKCTEYFGETVIIAPDGGDINGDGIVDIGDLTLLIDYLFISMQPLADPAAADVNNDCIVDIADLTLVISYLFISGDELVSGCAP